LFCSVNAKRLGTDLNHNTLIGATVSVLGLNRQNRAYSERNVRGVIVECNYISHLELPGYGRLIQYFHTCRVPT
jgi:hypothetical protein